MSRIALKGINPSHEVIVGLDRPLGQWFYQVWDTTGDSEAPIRCSMDECPPLQGPSQNAMLEFLRDNAAPCERKDTVVKYVSLDFDPGEAELPD